MNNVDASGKGEDVSEKKAEPKQATGGPVPFLLLLGAMLWLAHRDEVSPVVAWVALVGVVFAGVVVWGVRRWQQGRLGGLGGTGRGRGWDPVGRVEFAVVPERGGGRRRDGVGPGLGQQKGDPVVDFWSWLLHQAGSLHTADQRVVRLMWAHEGDGLVWGISVDRVLARSVKRAADKIWSENSIQPWLPDGRVEVSDRVPGGGTVVRRYIAPRVLSRPLHTALAYPDHPMAQVADVAAAHPAVDVQLRVDLVPLSAAERERVCRERLRTLGESDPDRSIWQTDKNPASVQGVRVMLRVSRGGPGHAAEGREVADRHLSGVGHQLEDRPQRPHSSEGFQQEVRRHVDRDRKNGRSGRSRIPLARPDSTVGATAWHRQIDHSEATRPACVGNVPSRGPRRADADRSGVRQRHRTARGHPLG